VIIKVFDRLLFVPAARAAAAGSFSAGPVPLITAAIILALIFDQTILWCDKIVEVEDLLLKRFFKFQQNNFSNGGRRFSAVETNFRSLQEVFQYAGRIAY
jgi:hypothetical protein